MGVSSDRMGFAPSVHYAGRCSRNPDRSSGEHDWCRADLEPEEE